MLFSGISYKARRRWKNFFIASIALALLLVIIWILWMLWLDRYVVYTRDGAMLDFSRSSRELSGEAVKFTEPPDPISIYYNEGPNTLISTAEMTQLSGYYIDAKMLEKDFNEVVATMRQLPAGTPVMIQVKDVMGRFFYSSALGSTYKNIDHTLVDNLIAELVNSDLYAIARFPAYREYLYAIDHVNHGLSSTKGQYLYWDPDRCYWLNPASDGAMSFLMAQLTEVKNLGFDEVVLSDFCFPNTTEIRFTGNKTQTLNSAAQLLTDTYTSERFVLSFEVTDADFILPEGRTRIYKTGCTAEETKKVAEKSGIEDTAVRLVFTTELLDTRFDPYGVLRPITSAEFE